MTQKFYGVMFDIDGVLEFQGKAYPGAVELLDFLRKKGVKINDVRNTYYRKRFYAGGRIIRKLHQRQLAAASASRSVKRIRLSKLSIF